MKFLSLNILILIVSFQSFGQGLRKGDTKEAGVKSPGVVNMLGALEGIYFGTSLNKETVSTYFYKGTKGEIAAIVKNSLISTEDKEIPVERVIMTQKGLLAIGSLSTSTKKEYYMAFLEDENGPLEAALFHTLELSLIHI